MRKFLLPLMLIMSSAIFAQTPPPIEPGVSQELARWRAARYQDVRYKLNLTLEKMSPVLKGTIEVRVRVREEEGEKGSGGEKPGTQAPSPASPQGGEAPPIILDWRKIKGHEDKSTISNVSINGKAALAAASVTTPSAAQKASGIHPSLDKEGSGPFSYAEQNEHLIFSDGVVVGENVIKLDFTSPILTSGSAITRYVDKEDGSEYIYSLFVPSDASTAFPVFDQPDLKARFELHLKAPREWNIVSNGYVRLENKDCFQDVPSATPRDCGPTQQLTFAETKPISTYVFAFAAGPWEKMSMAGTAATGSSAGREITTPSRKKRVPPLLRQGGEAEVSRPNWFEKQRAEKEVSSLPSWFEEGWRPLRPTGWSADWATSDDSVPKAPPATAGGTDKTAELSTSIYVRKSQAAKFKPHVAEVFRLNREAVKYFEQYFDYKFPFPKYDLVLIPEFPFGGMEHAGATFLREASIIFPQEPTKNDLVSRATLIFHEAAHQWFGDTVTMRWFDDLWLKEGFATFTAYKALEKIMPEMNAWKVFYERIKQGAYQTDSTRGTTAIYQPIANLSAAKSAYGNIVYNKAPAFLRQAEFYLGEDKFQTAVRAFLKKHEFGNAGWEDLVKELEAASGKELDKWADGWVKTRGGPVIRAPIYRYKTRELSQDAVDYEQYSAPFTGWQFKTTVYWRDETGKDHQTVVESVGAGRLSLKERSDSPIQFVFPNYGDYGYGIFLLDEKSRDYVLKNIQNEKDPFLRAMMWGALWDSVREGELDPRVFVELVVRVLGSSSGVTTPSAQSGGHPSLDKEGSEEDESTVATLLGRAGTALNYYVDDGVSSPHVSKGSTLSKESGEPSRTVGLRTRVEDLLIERMRSAPSVGQRITYYRAFLNIAAGDNARSLLKKLLATGGNLSGGEGASIADLGLRNAELEPNPKSEIGNPKSRGTLPAGRVSASNAIPLKTKDKFDIVTRLLILGDPDAQKLLADLEKAETSDDAKRYAYAAKAGIGTAENKAKYWNDFVNNKEISESWIEAAFGPGNSIRHGDLTLPYLERALKELPNHKRNRKIFFVNGWLGAFIGGQRSEEALGVVNKFLADNPGLDNDLRLKILENVDLIERAVKIRRKFPQV